MTLILQIIGYLLVGYFASWWVALGLFLINVHFYLNIGQFVRFQNETRKSILLIANHIKKYMDDKDGNPQV